MDGENVFIRTEDTMKGLLLTEYRTDVADWSCPMVIIIKEILSLEEPMETDTL